MSSLVRIAVFGALAFASATLTAWSAEPYAGRCIVYTDPVSPRIPSRLLADRRVVLAPGQSRILYRDGLGFVYGVSLAAETPEPEAPQLSLYVQTRYGRLVSRNISTVGIVDPSVPNAATLSTPGRVSISCTETPAEKTVQFTLQ